MLITFFGTSTMFLFCFLFPPFDYRTGLPQGTTTTNVSVVTFAQLFQVKGTGSESSRQPPPLVPLLLRAAD